MARVLVSPLDWGLGHVTRTIPVIRSLIDLQHEVVVGVADEALPLLKAEFPHLEFVSFPAYQPVYQDNRSMSVSMLSQLAKFYAAYKAENRLTEQLVSNYGITHIVSDHRYGVRSNSCLSYFFGHQLNIQVPSALEFLKPLINRIHFKFLQPFDSILIPDFPDRSLSGKLSDVDWNNLHFVGPVSRFPFVQLEKKQVPAFDLLVVLSGPEPQRSIFEKLIEAQVVSNGLKTCLVRGSNKEKKPDNSFIEYVNYANTNLLMQLYSESRMILSRPGYSSVMDYYYLGLKALLVPTPGQTEQEYLAEKLTNERLYIHQLQNIFSLKWMVGQYDNFPGFQNRIIPEKSLTETLRPYFV